MKVVALVAGLAVTFIAFVQNEMAYGRNLALADYLNWEEARDPQIAPDGSQILYTRRLVDKINDRWASEVWTMKADGTGHRFLVDGRSVRFSPDGDRIAFIGNDDETGRAQIFVRWMDGSGATSQMTREAMQIRSLSWSPDGARIAFRATVPYRADWPIDLPKRPEGAEWVDEPDIIDKLWFRFDRQGRRAGYTHLFVVTAEGGTPHQITKGEWDAGRSGDPVWTPDGNTLLFAARHEQDGEATSMASAIFAVNIASGAMRRLDPTDGRWSNPTVSPNGELVAYTGSAGAEVDGPTFPPVELHVVGLDGRNDRTIAADLGNNVRDIRWRTDGRGLYLTVGRDGSTNVEFVSLDGEFEPVTRGRHRYFLSSLTENGRIAVGVLSAPHVTPNVARLDMRDGELQQLTDLNGDILRDVDLGDVRDLNYRSADGTPIQGWRVLPPDFDPDATYPLLLAIHGGPHAMYGTNFNFPFQEMAASGFVVLYTNPRGSTGYGADFANAIDNQYPGPVDYADLMAGVDALLAEGYIDPDRLYVQGCSGGGILTSWIVTQTDRFAAAVARCPIVNWISAAGNTDITNGAHNLFRTRFWEDPSDWIDHSAIFHVKNVTTPTLLMTGERDLRTPIAQAEEFYIALKLIGVPTKLIAMRDEWHGTGRARPSNMLRTQLFMRKWFAEHGGGVEGAVDP